MKKKILGILLGAFLAVTNVFAQTATINWTNTHQVIDGFGATAPLTGDTNPNLTTAQNNFFFGTGAGQLGLSLLRVGLPDGGNGTFGNGNAVGNCSTVSISCVGGNLPEMQAVIVNGGRVYASPWSPPAIYKTNGNVNCTAGAGSGALATGSYANFATWITNFVKSLSTLESINLYAVSVQNEPNLCPGYDGALYNSSQIDTFIKTNLGPTFASNAISTLILTPETDNYGGLSGTGGTCFTDSACYNFVAGVNWHDYDATANSTGSVSAALNPWASLNKKYWETENSCGPGYGPSGCESGTAFVTDMPTDGLMWAGLLDDRLALENANAYLYFALVGPTTSNLSLTATNGAIAKRAYVFGQYSAFVRPGYVRIDATHLPQTQVAVSAYKLPSGSTMAIVATNYNASPVSQTFTLTNAPTFTTVTPVVTSASLSMVTQSPVTVTSNSFTYSLPAQSVVTFSGIGGGPPPPPNTQWAGILDPSRAIDWSKNGATIVNRSVQCGGTVSPYTGAATTISTALSACPSGQYVQLGAGTFSLSSTLVTTASNVTLRGMGPLQTFLQWTATSTNCNGVGNTAACVWNGDDNSFQFSGAQQTNWTGGYAVGSVNLTVTSSAGLNVGNNVTLSQNDDPADTGNVFVCQTNGTNGSCSQQGGQGVARQSPTPAAQTQQVTVTAINGNTVTVTPGIYAPNWSSTKNPQFWWSNNQTQTGLGIENLTLDYHLLGDGENGLEFHNTRGDWVKNIRSINNTAAGAARHKHINIYNSNHITVRDSYFYGASPTSEGYGVDAGPGSSNNLVENNIFQHLPTGTITETSCCNIFAYNYAVDNYYINGAPNWQQEDGFHHGAGDYYNLWEGHEGTGYNSDDIHGTSFMMTHFRDYLSGYDPVTVAPSAPNGPKNQSTFAYFPFAYNRYNNVVGSVLGGNLLPGATGPYHQFYQAAAANTTDCGNPTTSAASIFIFGYGRQNGTGYSNACDSGISFTIFNDLLVASTQMRWGNYTSCSNDAACNVVRWQASENASSAPGYPGLSSPSQTLPKSFYLSTIPGFWGSMPWPAVGPDVTGGNIPFVGGHAYHNPAAVCYLNVLGGKTDGSSVALNFDAANCYVAGRPLPPSNLTAVAH